MKSLRNILFLVIVLVVLGSQFVYILTARQDLGRKIQDNKDQIAATQREYEVLEQKLKLLPKTKEEFKKLNEEKTALLNTIPTNSSSAKEILQIFNIMDLNNFFKVSVKHNEDTDHQDDIGNIKEKKYALSFISTFAESEKFIEDLNGSYEMINIHNYNVDNAVQTSEDKEMKLIKLWYGDKAKELVTTKIEFSMFARPDEAPSDEIYEPEFNLNHSGDGIFYNRDKEKNTAETNTSEPGGTTPVSIPTENQNTDNAAGANGKFRLDISDPLTSGDTYKFLGPGNEVNSYSGLLSAANTYITVTIKDNGYDVVMEDENGKVKQNSVLIPIKDLNFTIFSRMRQLEKKMPQVHVYIRDYTSQPVNVTLNGRLLENIHIYNEFDEEVSKGETKGKVRLT